MILVYSFKGMLMEPVFTETAWIVGNDITEYIYLCIYMFWPKELLNIPVLCQQSVPIIIHQYLMMPVEYLTRIFNDPFNTYYATY